MRLSGHFVNAVPGRIFVTAWQDSAQSDVAVICAPPGVEELNTSRRQIAVQSQQLVKAGFDTFVMDYFGTGDSEGRDCEASYQSWQQSLHAVVEWVLKLGYRAVILWGIRIGSLVIADFLRQDSRQQICGILFWQPLESGNQWINALQRLQLLVGKGNQADKQFEVAGYQLTEALLDPVRNFSWEECKACLERYPIEILWISSQANAAARLGQNFTFAPSIIHVEGPPFWSIPESPVNQTLVSETTIRLQSLAGERTGRDD